MIAVSRGTFPWQSQPLSRRFGRKTGSILPRMERVRTRSSPHLPPLYRVPCGCLNRDMLAEETLHRSGLIVEIACTGWTQPRPFNGNTFDRTPTCSPSSKQSLQVPLLAVSYCHHLRHAPCHSCTRMMRLFPQCGLDLVKIGRLHRYLLVEGKAQMAHT